MALTCCQVPDAKVKIPLIVTGLKVLIKPSALSVRSFPFKSALILIFLKADKVSVFAL